jgi:hypothetical protein
MCHSLLGETSVTPNRREMQKHRAAYLGAHAGDGLQKALELLVERLNIGVRQILQREIVCLKTLWRGQRQARVAQKGGRQVAMQTEKERARETEESSDRIIRATARGIPSSVEKTCAMGTSLTSAKVMLAGGSSVRRSHSCRAWL